MEACETLRRWKSQLLVILAVVGPGFITANVDNDAGGIYTYSAGRRPVRLCAALDHDSHDPGAGGGAGDERPHGSSHRQRAERPDPRGIRLTHHLPDDGGLIICNFGNVVAEFAGIASSLELFHVSRFISVPLAALLVWLLVVKGDYKSVEKVFLAASFFYFAYIIAGVLAGPAWRDALAATVKPPHAAELKASAYVYMVIAVVGTTIAPWMQFYLQSSVVEKGIEERQYAASRVDVIVGCFFTDIVAWFIVVACAATLFMHGIRDVKDGADAAQALRPLAGDYAYLLFAAGLFNASLFAASILPISTAYTVCEALGFESGVDKKFSEAPAFYWLYTILLAAGGAVILLPNVPLVRISILSQVVNGMVLPFVLIAMLVLINKRELMGKHVNSRSFNAIAWATTIIMIVLTVVLMVNTLRGNG